MTYYHDNDIHDATWYESKPVDPSETSRWALLTEWRRQQTQLGLLTHGSLPETDSQAEVKQEEAAISDSSEYKPEPDDRLQVGSPDPGTFQDVHWVIMSPDGEIASLMGLQDFLNLKYLKSNLLKHARDFKVVKGSPLLPLPTPPTLKGRAPGDLTVRALSRFTFPYLDLDTYTAQLQDTVSSQEAFWEPAPPNVLRNRWQAPAEDWFLLKSNDWQALLPDQETRVGGDYRIPLETARHLLSHFGPPGETYTFHPERIREGSLRGTLLSSSAGLLAEVALQGRLILVQPWWAHQDDETAEAAVKGYLSFNPETRRLQELILVTEGACYKGNQRRPRLQIPFQAGLRTQAYPP